ncbi:helix-turn-helix transcriptional regulator [Acinetobacter indicus]|uniref:helix-turn-helix domain-containing protein n=1 Tax=Acinetobacter TaxID=469 RepID=UPI0015D2E3B0|nr:MULTISPECIES: helix-turn-helix transcriptional regulator [Acinetobacter]MCP0917981.1 helix-turn-helix transcriptional regulator [Acinetobacter indicus]
MALKQLRESRGWTLKELESRTGIDADHLAKYESGEAQPRGSSMGNLATAFDIDLSIMMNIVKNTPMAKEDDKADSAQDQQ